MHLPEEIIRNQQERQVTKRKQKSENVRRRPNNNLELSARKRCGQQDRDKLEGGVAIWGAMWRRTSRVNGDDVAC